MKKIFFLFTLLVIIASSGYYFWWENGISPVNKEDKTNKIFIIKSGESTKQITDNLNKQGLIRNPMAFLLLIKQMEVSGRIQAGNFLINRSMSAREILNRLQVGTIDVKITIPEGKRAEEIADILEENFPNFSIEWRKKLNAEEGYLFPDTYYLSKNSNIDEIISKMKENFENKYALISSANNKFSKKQIVTIASLIEREARFSEDKKYVSSVIINRLKEDMPLQIDASVQYAIGYQTKTHSWWKKDLTRDDLTTDSKYNTYTNIGLPPGPISNPGLDTLTAVISSPSTDYIYYVSDSQGHNHYAVTLDEHNSNIKKYNVN